MVFLNGPRRYDMLKLINRLITFMSGIICYHPLKVDTSPIYMSASDMGQHSFVNIVKDISLFPDNQPDSLRENCTCHGLNNALIFHKLC